MVFWLAIYWVPCQSCVPFLYGRYRGVQLIRTMKIVEKPSELAKSSELAASCGWSIFDLKRDFLSTISTYFFYKRSNIVLKYSKTQFLHSEIRFMRLKIAKKKKKWRKIISSFFPKSRPNYLNRPNYLRPDLLNTPVYSKSRLILPCFDDLKW